MLCWVYISDSSISPGILFVYYSKKNGKKYFGKAIKDATLATNRSDIRSEKLALKASLWVNGRVVDQTSFNSTWTLGTGYCAIPMGAVRLLLESLNKTFKFNISLTKQMEAAKCVSRRGKNISYKACVCNRSEHIQLI